MGIQKIKKRLLDCFFLRRSVKRSVYYEDLRRTIIVLEGLIQSDAHHSQIEQNLISEVGAIKKKFEIKKAQKEANNKKKEDVSFQ